MLALGLLAGSAAQAGPPTDWPQRLEAELALVDAQHRADLGVYVRDIRSGESASHRTSERWYLASMLKVPVAISVLRGIERGDYTLDTTLTLRVADLLDGGGPTKRLAPGVPLTIRFLLEQMIVWSDNTASDMLIGLVGVRQVNETVHSLVPHGFERITGFADVRRQVYGHLTGAAAHLGGMDFVLLVQQRSDAERLDVLARLLDVPKERFSLPSLNDAYDAYYASGLNAGRLDAYAELLVLLAEGKALAPQGTAQLLATMARVKTGPRRIKAGLPAPVRFAHKTGTQRGVACDAGIVTVPRFGLDRRLVVVACTRGEPVLAQAERALHDVGVAICKSGLLNHAEANEATCDAVARPGPEPHAAER